MMLRSLAGLSCALALLLACAGCHRDEHRRRLIVVIVPSQDNPYFKAEADAAAARALESVIVCAWTHMKTMPSARTIWWMPRSPPTLQQSFWIMPAPMQLSRRCGAPPGRHRGVPDRSRIDATGIAKAQIISDNDQVRGWLRRSSRAP